MHEIIDPHYEVDIVIIPHHPYACDELKHRGVK